MLSSTSLMYKNCVTLGACFMNIWHILIMVTLMFHSDAVDLVMKTID